MGEAEPRVVEIRVIGTPGPLVHDRLPGFEAASARSVTVISGRLDPGEDLTAVLAVLVKYGLQALDTRMFGQCGTAPRRG